MQYFSVLLMLSSSLVVLASPAPMPEPTPMAPTPVIGKRFATNVLPASKGYSALSTPKVIAAGASFDGGM